MKRSRIRRVSKKHKAELEKYYRLREVFLLANPLCQCGDCIIRGNQGFGVSRATQVHHKRRRGKCLNDVSTWMAVCASCHNFIEENPNYSRTQGWLLT